MSACLWEKETEGDLRRRDGWRGENREVIVYVRVRQPGLRGRSRSREREGGRDVLLGRWRRDVELEIWCLNEETG